MRPRRHAEMLHLMMALGTERHSSGWMSPFDKWAFELVLCAADDLQFPIWATTVEAGTSYRFGLRCRE